jgi:pyruvate kinase
MKPNHVVAGGRHANVNQLIAELGGMRSEMVRMETLFAAKAQQVHEKHRESARNFLHYLALRQRDIRSLQ